MFRIGQAAPQPERGAAGVAPAGGPLTELSAPPGFWLLRLGRWSVLAPWRPLLAAGGLALAVLLACGLALAFGSAGLSPLQALAALFGRGAQREIFVVRELRLERVIAGGLVGAALGMAGCLLQTLARNRLATPDIVGIDNGATAFAVASIVALPTSLAPSALALVGAATVTAVTFGLSGGAGARGYRFIVVGIGVGAVCGALTNLLLMRARFDLVSQAFPWTVGSLNARPFGPVRLLAAGLGLGLPAALALRGTLSAMRLPEGVALALGLRTGLARAATLAVAVAWTALAVAVAGPIGVVALAGPELARRLAGPRAVPLIGAGLAGALLLLLADLAGRTLLAPQEVPAGIVTALVGGPYVLWVLLRAPARSLG